MQETHPILSFSSEPPHSLPHLKHRYPNTSDELAPCLFSIPNFRLFRIPSFLISPTPTAFCPAKHRTWIFECIDKSPHGFYPTHGLQYPELALDRKTCPQQHGNTRYIGYKVTQYYCTTLPYVRDCDDLTPLPSPVTSIIARLLEIPSLITLLRRTHLVS